MMRGLWRCRESTSLCIGSFNSKRLIRYASADGMSTWCLSVHGDTVNWDSVPLVAHRSSVPVADGMSAEYSRYRRDAERIHQRRRMLSLEAYRVSISAGGDTSTECWAYYGDAEDDYQRQQSCLGVVHQTSVSVGDGSSTWKHHLYALNVRQQRSSPSQASEVNQISRGEDTSTGY
jgi:hypothetical protein